MGVQKSVFKRKNGHISKTMKDRAQVATER